MPLFRKKHASALTEKTVDDEKSITDTTASVADTDQTVLDVKYTQAEEDAKVPPVGFFSLFRFATSYELFLNGLALVAAAGAGAAQPLMSLIFGNLTNSFVRFGTAVQQQIQNPSAEGAQLVRDLAKSFRHDASTDALILVGIGESSYHLILL